MKKRVLFLGMMLVLMLVCLTGCKPFNATIELRDNGEAALISATAYYPESFRKDWCTANKDVPDESFPNWVSNHFPLVTCEINLADIDSGEPYQLVTSTEADIFVYDHMKSKGVYEIAANMGLYDVNKLKSQLSEFDCDFTVMSDGKYGIDKVVMGSSTYEPGHKYVTDKGNGVWNINVAGIVSENWNYVTTADRGLVSMLIYLEQDSSIGNRTNSAFTDVADSAWYAEAINTMYNNGLINGVGGGRFAPTSELTIDQVCRLLTNIVAVEVPSYGQSYWAFDVVKYAIDHHWIIDRGPINAQNYGVPMNRAEAFTAMGMAFGIGGNDPTTTRSPDRGTKVNGASQSRPADLTEGLIFTADNRKLTAANAAFHNKVRDTTMAELRTVSWDYGLMYGEGIIALWTQGIINGGTNGELMPLKNLTRAEFCQMVWNLMYYDTEDAMETLGYASHLSLADACRHARDQWEVDFEGGYTRIETPHEDLGHLGRLK